MENKLYNPAAQPKDWLINNFVARTQVFKRLFKDLQNGTMKYPEQHYLIQGQRGMGKTTLLLRLKYEIENTSSLNKWMVPVFFNEESYDLTSLSNLWEKLLKYLDNIWKTGGEYYSKTDAFIGSVDYEKQCFELLINILHGKKKKLVIFFDNFGQLFLDNLKEKEQHRFREILMNCNEFRIIGASAVVLHDLHDYSKPFFEFFKVINLNGLDKNETLQLITKLQENAEKKIDIQKNKAKIETLAILSGGVIRTIMLIYEVVLADQDGTALQDLETILDRITPLYKHRIEDLPVQQRKIIDVIAKRWDAISAKDIAENIREDGKPIATKIISAQLQQLEKNNVVEKKQTTTKNHLYQLNERFFNIWYLMRNGDRLDKCRVMWLTKFLETWYDDQRSIESFIKNHIELLKSGKYNPSSALLVAEAITNSSKVDFENQASLIKATDSILDENQKRSLPPISLEKYSRALKYFEAEKYEDALNTLKSIEQNSEKANLLLFSCHFKLKNYHEAINCINPNNKMKPFLLGISYSELRQFDKSINYLQKALNIKSPIIEEIGGTAAFMIAQIYKDDLDDISNAIKYLKKSIELSDDFYEDLISLLIDQKQYRAAEKYLLNAIVSGKVEFKKRLVDFYIYQSHNYKKAKALVVEGLLADKDDPDYLFYDAIMLYYSKKSRDTTERLLETVRHKFNKEKGLRENYLFTVLILSSIYIDNKNKNKALSIISDLDESFNAPQRLLKSIIYLWIGQFEKSFDLFKEQLNWVETGENETEKYYFEFYFLILIAKKQLHFASTLFNQSSGILKDRFKPIYYALMYHLKDEYPNEYIKMGEELKQPVEDVLKRIEQIAIDYA